jgi:hypothetical protein
LLLLLPVLPSSAQIWYLPDGMRCFQDPTEVEWIEDKLWSQRLDEGWDLAEVGTVDGGKLYATRLCHCCTHHKLNLWSLLCMANPATCFL